MKCVMQMRYPDLYERPSFEGPTLHIENSLKSAIYVAFIIQMVPIFDDGLTVVWDEKKPGTIAPALRNKVKELAKLGVFLNADDALTLALRRNELAHEPDVKANSEDWQWAYDMVKRELHHMGLVAPPK
jgi:hypothetical protein